MLRKLFRMTYKIFQFCAYTEAKILLFFAITHSQFCLPLSFLSLVSFFLSLLFYSDYLLRCIFFLAAVKSWMLTTGEA